MPAFPKPHVSFEFFPPKTPEADEKLWTAILELEPLLPDFVSVTYGAGGTTRDRTHSIVKRIVQETSLKPAAHLTCVAASRAEVDAVAKEHWDAGIRHILALRGDPPKDTGAYKPHPEGYLYSSDLVKGLKKIGDFEISVAAFPESHPQSNGYEQDMKALEAKVKNGATRAITQYFFDIEHFLRLRDKIKAAGITVQLVPGIIPIGNFAQLVRFSAMCGATVPAWLHQRFDGLDEKHEARDKEAITFATEQCVALQKEGVDRFHFYTLNRSDLTTAVCNNLGIVAA